MKEDWKAGIEKFNSHHYWEAHESWERGWKNLKDPEKTRVQIAIQAAAAFYLLRKKRIAPAQRLCLLILNKMERVKTRETPRVVIPHLKPCLKLVLATHPELPIPARLWKRIYDLKAVIK
jgi:hypothetical protein